MRVEWRPERGWWGQIHDLKGLGMHHLATGPIAMLRKVPNQKRIHMTPLDCEEMPMISEWELTSRKAKFEGDDASRGWGGGGLEGLVEGRATRLRVPHVISAAGRHGHAAGSKGSVHHCGLLKIDGRLRGLITWAVCASCICGGCHGWSFVSCWWIWTPCSTRGC